MKEKEKLKLGSSKLKGRTQELDEQSTSYRILSEFFYNIDIQYNNYF